MRVIGPELHLPGKFTGGVELSAQDCFDINGMRIVDELEASGNSVPGLSDEIESAVTIDGGAVLARLASAKILEEMGATLYGSSDKNAVRAAAIIIGATGSSAIVEDRISVYDTVEFQPLTIEHARLRLLGIMEFTSDPVVALR